MIQTNILSHIIANKKEKLPFIIKEHRKKYSHLIDEHRQRKSFYKAMSKRGLSIIGEIKKASPSQGVIKEDFNPLEIAKNYENHVDAISVLTEEDFFQGSLDYLYKAHKAVDLPLLCKDFIIDQIQIDMAYQLGASCILLIAGILSQSQLQEYVEYTGSLGLDTLVEVHTEKELEKVLQTEAKIIGINNRNLSTFDIDLKTTINLRKLIPDDYVVISESGLHTKKDIEYLLGNSKINGILVGESFMRALDISIHAQELKDGYKD